CAELCLVTDDAKRADDDNGDDDLNARLAALWRIESATIIGAVARIVKDVGVAEEIASAAFVKALETWPARGVPDKPGAWLMQTAKHRALDHVRRTQMMRGKEDAIVEDADREANAGAAAGSRAMAKDA